MSAAGESFFIDSSFSVVNRVVRCTIRFLFFISIEYCTLLLYDILQLMDELALQSDFNAFRKLSHDDPSVIVTTGLALLPRLTNEKYIAQRADVRYTIGIARITRGEYESAFRSLSEARHLHEEIDDEQNSLLDQLAFGIIYGLSEQPEAAFESFLSIRDRARNLNYPEIEEAADCYMSRICFDQRRFEEGLGFINAALKIIETTGNMEHKAAALHEKGRIELHQGYIETAALHLEEARNISEGISGAFGYEYIISLGDLYTRNGQFDQARKSLETALERCREKGIPHGEIMSLFHMGNLHEATGDIPAAIEYWKQCYDKTDATVLRHLKIKSGEKLVDQFHRSGDHEEAIRYLEDIRRIEHVIQDERLHHTISVYDQSMRIDDLEKEMQSWRRRSGELEKIRNDREEAIRELRTITLIGEKITSSLDPDTIVGVLYDSLSQLVTVNGLSIAFYDKDDQELDLRYVIEDGHYIEPSSIPMKPEESLTAWVIHNDCDLMINSREEGSGYTRRIHHIQGSELLSESFLMVRLRIEGRIIGVLSVQALERNRYRARHLQVLQALASFIAIAMTNSSAHQSLVLANEKIAHMATHDPLTTLPNRMQILSRLGQEIERCKRYEKALAVLFIDLDGFKEINDTHGHRAGDEVLKSVAERLIAGIRATDATGRLAGDEFLVILTDDCTPENGILLADQIRENLSRPILFNNKELRVTASIGMAFYPADATDPGELVNAADQAMYDAKDAGKNLTCIHRLASGNPDPIGDQAAPSSDRLPESDINPSEEPSIRPSTSR